MWLALVSIIVGIVVLGIKLAAYWVTGSLALYSDAMESIVNVATAGAAFTAVWLSAIPPDANHPYGHHKAEYLSAVLEGVLIVIAAMLIFHKVYLSYGRPNPLTEPAQGLAINAAAGVLNAAWCFALFSYGRRWRSPALVADARHLLTDVITTAGVLVGVALVPLTGWQQLDAIVAALVGANILWTGWRLVRSSVGGLMDEAASPEIVARIKEVIAEHAEGAIEAHDLRTRHAGRITFLDFHLVVPGSMTVVESHAICDRIEAALKTDVQHLVVTIHVEPEEKAKHAGKITVL